MINFRIVALDPGGTTGWATWSAERIIERHICRFAEETWNCGQIGPREHHNTLDQLLGHLQVQDTVIVCESFMHYRDRNPVELVPLEYIGVVKKFSQERHVPVVFQSSSEGKIGSSSFVRKVNLQALDLWYANLGHAMDAYGHLLYYMIHGRGVPIAKRNELLRKGWK